MTPGQILAMHLQNALKSGLLTPSVHSALAARLKTGGPGPASSYEPEWASNPPVWAQPKRTNPALPIGTMASQFNKMPMKRI